MAVFNCKSCGGDLEIQEGTTVVTCEYCGRQQTVPSMDNEKKVNLFNRANRLRSKCDFDKAASVYESIVAEFPQESEAYWGLCLCKFGIEYVDDPGTANKIPTCHRTSYESIFDDQNFDMACENADALAVNQLRGEAKEIDRLQKEILEIAKNEQPFDVFICYKESDEAGNRTVDSELAHDIYDVLTEKGYKVFYSRITLKAKLGQDYEPYIFSALNSAKVMLSVGTKFEHFNAVWVKNEWSRFLSLMRSDKSKMLIPCYRDIDPYDMPKEFSGLQGQDLSSPRAFQDLVTNIEKIIPKKTSQPSVIAAPETAAAEPLLKRAFMCLEDGDWNGADKCCEKILDIDPENARAYLAKLCLELRVSRPEELADCDKPFDDNNSFKKAIRFADEQLKNELNGYSRAVIDRIEMTEKEILEKAEKYYEECDYEAAENWFKKIPGNKNAKERLDLIENINQFTHKCHDIKSAREQELLRAFEMSDKLSENKRLSRALLLSSAVWMACTLAGFFIFLDSLPGSLIIALVCNIAAVIISVKQKVGKRAVLPVIMLAVIGFFGSVRFSGFIGVIPFAAAAVFAVIYWRYGKKYDDSLAEFGNIRKGLHSDIDELESEYKTLPDDIKKPIKNKIFGEDYWNALSKPVGYSDKAVETGKSGPLFALVMCLIAVNIAVPFIFMAINAGRYDDYYDDNSNFYSGNSSVNSPVQNEPELNTTEAILKKLTENRGLANKNPTIAAAYHTLAVNNDGTVRRNGYNKYGQCDTYNWNDIVSVSAGNYHSLGLRSDGTVVAVGLNESKQCNVSDWRNIIAVAAGVEHSVGLKSDGTVVATGSNHSGECNVSGWHDIISISAGNDYTLGLKSDGTVVTTRSGGDVLNWKDIVAIEAGQLQTIGIKSDGSVVTTVDSAYSYYGQGNILGWSDIIAVSTGTYFAAGLKSDGTVVAAGDNQYGQCNVSGWKDIVAIAVGEEYIIGLKSDGTVVATGNNEDGACNVSDWADIALPGTRSVGSGSQGGSSNSGSSTPTVDYTDIDNIFNTRVGNLIDNASDVNTSFMGYTIDYKGKNGTFYVDVMTDIFDSSHINDVPNGLQFPIKLLIPGKSSYTLDELRSIFGSQLSVNYYTDGMDGPGYSVIVNGKYYIQFTNGSKGIYDNSETTSPFTSCYINRFNNFN